ncbi:MAG: hypothetical protein ABSA05_06225 [Opitutaceae bacterium]|jgi:hypothetical protein
MFYTLLLVTFTLSILVSWFVARIFSKPANLILRRIIQDDVCQSWSRYLMFAIYVVGISAGVRITELERYVTAPALPRGAVIVELTTERWVVETYRTIIGTLQGLAWVLLIFFAFTLLAFVIVRVFETRHPKT